jgi:hypothetical protein
MVMAKKALKAGALPDNIEPEARYRITVSRTLSIGGKFVMRPSSASIVVKGHFLSTLPQDAIKTAEKV